MGSTHKSMYHDTHTHVSYGQENRTVYYPSYVLHINIHVSYVLDNRLYITLLMGITHKPMYHMDWTTDCILPF